MNPYKHFAAGYRFTHTTSSLHYPQINEEAEKAINTIKNLLMKSDDLAMYWTDDIQFFTISSCISELLMNTQVCTILTKLVTIWKQCCLHVWATKKQWAKLTSRNILMYYNYVCDYRSLSNFQDNKSGYVGGEIVLWLLDSLQDHNCINPKWKAAKKQMTFDIDSRFW